MKNLLKARLFIFCILLLEACGNEPETANVQGKEIPETKYRIHATNDSTHNSRDNELEAYEKRLCTSFRTADSLRISGNEMYSEAFDSLVDITTDSLYKFLHLPRSPFYKYQCLTNHFSIVSSPDNKIRSLTWQVPMGGTQEEYVNMLQYLSPGNSIRVYREYAAGYFWREIYSLSNTRPLYLAIASGKGCYTCYKESALLLNAEKDSLEVSEVIQIEYRGNGSEDWGIWYDPSKRIVSWKYQPMNEGTSEEGADREIIEGHMKFNGETFIDLN